MATFGIQKPKAVWPHVSRLYRPKAPLAQLETQTCSGKRWKHVRSDPAATMRLLAGFQSSQEATTVLQPGSNCLSMRRDSDK